MLLKRPVPEDRRSGFALIITITLLSFLVLLLVSLASLTRVETQVASNNQQISQARQNALLGLNIAIGRLQALAGPDRRITATAEIVSGSHADKRRWTGVWNTSVATPAPEWLVSAGTPAASTGTAAVTSAMPSTGTVTLVGSNSVDTNITGNSVAVETQPITSDSVPGFSAPQTIGNFAYWVGDEGVKAKVNLIDPGAASTATAEEISRRLRVAQRSGIELVDSATSTPPTPLSQYPANNTALSKVLDLKQLSLPNTAGQSALSAAVKNRFHDLTASSYSVLADVAQGGLKKDLTTWLAHPSGLPATAPADGDFITKPHPSDTAGYGLPRWGIIRSYAGFESGVPHSPQQQTATQQGLHPVITYFRIGFSASSDEDTPANPTPPLRIHVYPVVVLWNPHDTPIAASQYELAYGLRGNSATNVFVNTTKNPAAPDAETPPSWQLPPAGTNTRKGRLLMHTADMTNATSTSVAQSNRRYFRFLLDAPVMAAGQSLVFTLDNTGRYTAGTSGKLPNRMSPNTDYRKDNSAYFENTGITMTADDIWINTVTRTTRRQLYVLTNGGELEFGLFPVQPAGTNPTVAESIASNPYQLIQHIGIAEYARRFTAVSTIDMDDTHTCAYHWALMQMSKGNKYFRTTRWLAHGNPRAPLQLASTAIVSQIYTGSSYSGVPGFNTYNGNEASAGETISAPPVTTTAIAGFQPGATGEPWKRFFSLAQLQHANVSLLSQNPAYAIGNSQVSYHIYRSDGTVGLADSSISGAPLDTTNTVYYPSNQLQRVYDLSYLLNRELWDRYFFSTVPSSGAGVITAGNLTDPAFHLPNARHVFHLDPADADTVAAGLTVPAAFDTASAHLLVNGGFNINSTSEQAWRALLASHNNVDTVGAFSHPFARFPSTAVGGTANQAWTSGYRILSDAQIKTLAQKIVAEVKTRGPFLSLADFVNRRLINNTTGYKGALQSAIDATDTETTAANRINDLAPFNDYSTASPNETHKILTYGSSEGSTPPADFQQLFRGGTTTADTPSASRAAFGPGFLTQADLLQSLGPVLAARSDTFVIRAYGDVQNPATTSVEGKAWCEAVVQRFPDYTDSSLPAETDLTTAPSSPAKTINLTFGRRFKVVSFRWLNAGDI